MDERLVAADAAIKAGDSAGAADLIIASLTEFPDAPFAAYRILVNHLYGLKRYAEGAHWAEKALERDPRNFDVANLRGVLLRRSGRHAEALKALDYAQRLKPKDLSPMVNKANIYNDLENGPAAEALFQKLVRVNPRSAEYQRGLGRALIIQKKLGPAAIRFRQAVTLKKDYVDAWLDISGLESARQNHVEALAAIERGIEASPDEPRLLEAKAILVRRSGRMRDAEAFLLTLLPSHENEAWLHFQLAGAVSDFDRPRANIHYRRALELAPEKLEHRLALAESLERTREGNEGKNIDLAYETLKEATPEAKLNPTYAKIASEIFVRVADFAAADAIGSFNDIGRSWATSGKHTALLKHLARAKTPEDRLELIKQHRMWGDSAIADAKQYPLAMPQPKAPGPKFRLGFMSSDLRRHPVAYFAAPLFEHADRERFEVYCYSFYQGNKADSMQQRIASQVDVFRWDQAVSDRDAAQMIANDHIDMLIELGGSTHMNKLGVMAYKPARLSASWLGYPHSSGLTTIDYLIVDPFLKPPKRELLIEEPLVMPKTWIAMGELSFPETNVVNPVPPVHRNGFITFGTANNPYKYSPEMLAVWARVMKAVPHSRFIFIRPEGGSDAFRANIRRIFLNEGIAPERVLFNAVRGMHMPVYNELDITLDTFPQTGGTTTCESLWMGVPTVSRVGEALFERLSFSILNNAGLADLTATSEEEFVEIAVKLANDQGRIVELRRGLRDRLKASPLCQRTEFAKDFYDMIHGAVSARSGVRQSA
jgi:predicted O-linked N-acetylglucosamine transferase (SPINDLY family)